MKNFIDNIEYSDDKIRIYANDFSVSIDCSQILIPQLIRILRKAFISSHNSVNDMCGKVNVLIDIFRDESDALGNHPWDGARFDLFLDSGLIRCIIHLTQYQFIKFIDLLESLKK